MPPAAPRVPGAGTTYPADPGSGNPPPGYAGQQHHQHQQQRSYGTVYGGPAPAPHRDGAAGYIPNSASPGYFPQSAPRSGPGGGGRDPNPSGSLSGHLLGQEDETAQRSGTTKTIIVLAVALGLMILVSLALAFFAQDWISDTLGSIFG